MRRLMLAHHFKPCAFAHGYNHINATRFFSWELNFFINLIMIFWVL